MRISPGLRRKGGSGAERPRPVAVLLGLTAFLGLLLALGCAGTTVSPRDDATLDPPPLPLGDDGNVRPVGWTSERVANKSDGNVSSSATSQQRSTWLPQLDPETYHIPAPQIATDGPIAQLFSPSNEGPWSPDQAVLPWAEFHNDIVTKNIATNDIVTVHNIRNSLYRTVDDYTVRLYDKTYDLRKLTSVDLIVVPFNDNPSIAHVAISFGFEDKDFLITSVEIRKRVGQKYSAAAGFFNQYTLMYVLVDEHDMLWKETVGFQSELYIYRTMATPKLAKEMFVDVMRRVNKLVREPEFYNTITNNCTTNIRNHVNHFVPDGVPYDYRVLLPGYAPEMAYDLGLLVKHGSFEATKAAAKANFNAYLYMDDPDFSRKIRGLQAERTMIVRVVTSTRRVHSD